jgi:hypothetical protein
VPHHLHADTAILRAARVAAEELRAALRPEALDPRDLTVLAAVSGGATLVAEHDRLLVAVRRSAGELAELDAALGTAVAALETAESTAVRSLTVGDR